jgi:hypothetical protein
MANARWSLASAQEQESLANAQWFLDLSEEERQRLKAESAYGRNNYGPQPPEEEAGKSHAE